MLHCSFIYLFIYTCLYLRLLHLLMKLILEQASFLLHASWNLGHIRVNPTVFTGMWVYLPFCTSPTTKPEIGPLLVTRKQTIIDMIERSKKNGCEKDEEKREKKWQQKERDFCQSSCYSLVTLHSMAIDSCLKGYISPTFPQIMDLANLEDALQIIFHGHTKTGYIEIKTIFLGSWYENAWLGVKVLPSVIH